MEKVQSSLGVSERRACQALGQHRSTQRKPPQGAHDEDALTADVIELAKTYGRYGYRRITALLHEAGWIVNVKRVQRIWRREGLKVPQKQPKRARLWLNDGSCVRLRASWPNHVWSYDFVEARTHDGRKFRMLCLIDEFTREALALRVKRRLNCQCRANFPHLCRSKIPQIGRSRHAGEVTIFGRPAAWPRRRRRSWRCDGGLRAKMLGHEFGVLTEAVA